MSIIRVTAFPSSSSAAFHLHLNSFPNHESVRTEWPQPCSTHHEHHPVDGFPLLFFCSPSLASEFLPKSQECARNGRNHAARIMSIIRVTAFPSSFSAAFHLHLNLFQPKSRECALNGCNHSARIMSIIRVTAFPSSSFAAFHLHLRVCAPNGRNHAARIMSIIRVTAFPSSSCAAFHLGLNFFPDHESAHRMAATMQHAS